MMLVRKAIRRRNYYDAMDDRQSIPTERPNAPVWGKRMYAIAFDLDTESLKRHYHNQSWENAYPDLGRAFARFGFHRQQGSVYFGDDNVTPVTCVLAVQAASNVYPWLK